ncbi:hypothetical protein SiRe_0814 [Sulfolobus islandicus REY15A]|uniref:Uncharacterized protein n=1 Tax=Saccharolobus islandicus (strain REY15A) TaxID=930945 RepID=F0NH92_SACI5|nr:hypothetical protein SiRe_0814 [Sulfolobus islandicus REY15A]
MIYYSQILCLPWRNFSLIFNTFNYSMDLHASMKDWGYPAKGRKGNGSYSGKAQGLRIDM